MQAVRALAVQACSAVACELMREMQASLFFGDLFLDASHNLDELTAPGPTVGVRAEANLGQFFRVRRRSWREPQLNGPRQNVKH